MPVRIMVVALVLSLGTPAVAQLFKKKNPPKPQPKPPQQQQPVDPAPPPVDASRLGDWKPGDPADPEARKALAQKIQDETDALVKANENGPERPATYERAYQRYKEVVRLNPEETLGWVKLHSAAVYSGQRERGYLAQAWWMYYARQYKKAEPIFDGLVRYNTMPDLQMEAYIGRAMVYIATDRSNQAINDLNNFVFNAKIPPTQLAYKTRADLLASMGKHAEAQRDLDELARLQPGNDTASFDRGRAFMTAGKYEAAVAEFDKVLATTPTHAQAIYLRAGAMMAQQKYDRAIIGYTRLLNATPSDVPSLLGRASAYACTGKMDEAMADVNAAIEQGRWNGAAYGQRATLHRLRGNRGEALADLEKAARMKPDLAGWATEQASKLVAAAPESPDGYRTRARVLMLGNSWKAATADLDKCQQLKQDDADLHCERATCLAALDRKKEALAEFDRAIQMKPDHAQALAGKGGVLYDQGSYDAARDAFTAAIKADKYNAPAYKGRAFVDLKLAGPKRNYYMQAIDDLENADNYDGTEDADIQAALGTAHIIASKNTKDMGVWQRSLGAAEWAFGRAYSISDDPKYKQGLEQVKYERSRLGPGGITVEEAVIAWYALNIYNGLAQSASMQRGGVGPGQAPTTAGRPICYTCGGRGMYTVNTPPPPGKTFGGYETRICHGCINR